MVMTAVTVGLIYMSAYLDGLHNVAVCLESHSLDLSYRNSLLLWCLFLCSAFVRLENEKHEHKCKYQSMGHHNFVVENCITLMIFIMQTNTNKHTNKTVTETYSDMESGLFPNCKLHDQGMAVYHWFSNHKVHVPVENLQWKVIEIFSVFVSHPM